jgi:uncharacterized protein YukE
VNPDPALSLAVSPDLLRARAALDAQSAGLGLALARLERLRSLCPTAAPGDDWRGAAHAAYRAGVHELTRQLDEAAEAVSSARRATDRALAVLDARA